MKYLNQMAQNIVALTCVSVHSYTIDYCLHLMYFQEVQNSFGLFKCAYIYGCLTILKLKITFCITILFYILTQQRKFQTRLLGSMISALSINIHQYKVFSQCLTYLNFFSLLLCISVLWQ